MNHTARPRPASAPDGSGPVAGASARTLGESPARERECPRRVCRTRRRSRRVVCLSRPCLLDRVSDFYFGVRGRSGPFRGRLRRCRTSALHESRTFGARAPRLPAAARTPTSPPALGQEPPALSHGYSYVCIKNSKIANIMGTAVTKNGTIQFRIENWV